MLDKLIDKFADCLDPICVLVAPFEQIGHFLFRMISPCFAIALYTLIGTHFYAFIKFITPLLKRRYGTFLGLVWTATGLILVFNICYNHMMALMIKPGGPKDLIQIEKLRIQLKKKAGRKQIKSVNEPGDFADNDKFCGLSQQVKTILRYRTKTISDLEVFWTKYC